MDLTLQQLRRDYLNGDNEAGVALLSAYIRAGIIPRNYAKLAAAYKHPIAIELFGDISEGDVLPCPDEGVDFIDWPCELYIRRLLAVTRLAYTELREHILNDNVIYACYEGFYHVEAGLKNMHQIDESETKRIFEGIMSFSNDYLNYGEAMDRAIYNLILAAGGTVRALGCDDEHGIISSSGPSWACASLSHLEDALDMRDPSLPQSPADAFGPTVMDKAYGAVAEELVPWLLDPFPA